MAEIYKLVISYDGTGYHGWQRQPQKKTIQGALETALAKVSKRNIPIIGAGRTDAGVHAEGQVAHFRARLTLNEEEIRRAMNSLLPRDIRIVSVERAVPSFHARKDALSKVYRYRIINSPEISPFLTRYALHWPPPLDVEAMGRAAALFVRKADFTSFSSNRLLHPVREVFRSEIRRQGREIIYTVEANGFLRYMVRTMAGTLLEVGKGRQPPEIIEELFARKRRSLQSPTAPAHGLCLVRVNYGPRLKPMTMASSGGSR